MEKDPEMKGDGNSYTTEFRQYDPRLGRWLSLDPLAYLAPAWNPYRFGFNNPVIHTDPTGLYETKREARQAMRGARDAGYKCGEIKGTKGNYWFQATLASDKEFTSYAFTTTKLIIKPGKYTGGIEFYDAADARGGIPPAQAHLAEKFKMGMYEVVPYYVDGKLDHYVAGMEVKDPSDLTKTTVRYDFIIGRDKLDHFEDNIGTFELASITAFGYGSKLHLDENQINLANGNIVEGMFGFLIGEWTNPVKVIFGLAGTIQGLSMPKAVQNNLSRMRMPANARGNVTVSRNGIGQYRIDATSPGKVPGSKAVYTKIVNNNGKTLNTYKTTYGPDGKVIHTKNKMK